MNIPVLVSVTNLQSKVRLSNIKLCEKELFTPTVSFSIRCDDYAVASLTARYYCADPDSKKRLQSVGLVHIATSCILCWNTTKLAVRHSKTWTGGENKCDFVVRNIVWRRFTNNGQQTTTVPRMCFEFYTLICHIFFTQSKLLSPC